VPPATHHEHATSRRSRESDRQASICGNHLLDETQRRRVLGAIAKENTVSVKNQTVPVFDFPKGRKYHSDIREIVLGKLVKHHLRRNRQRSEIVRLIDRRRMLVGFRSETVLDIFSNARVLAEHCLDDGIEDLGLAIAYVQECVIRFPENDVAVNGRSW
jgi:hypothetical protein